MKIQDITFFNQIDGLKDWLDEEMDAGRERKGKKIANIIKNMTIAWRKNGKVVKDSANNNLKIYNKVFCEKYCQDN